MDKTEGRWLGFGKDTSFILRKIVEEEMPNGLETEETFWTSFSRCIARKESLVVIRQCLGKSENGSLKWWPQLLQW